MAMVILQYTYLIAQPPPPTMAAVFAEENYPAMVPNANCESSLPGQMAAHALPFNFNNINHTLESWAWAHEGLNPIACGQLSGVAVRENNNGAFTGHATIAIPHTVPAQAYTINSIDIANIYNPSSGLINVVVTYHLDISGFDQYRYDIFEYNAGTLTFLSETEIQLIQNLPLYSISIDAVDGRLAVLAWEDKNIINAMAWDITSGPFISPLTLASTDYVQVALQAQYSQVDVALSHTANHIGASGVNVFFTWQNIANPAIEVHVADMGDLLAFVPNASILAQSIAASPSVPPFTNVFEFSRPRIDAPNNLITNIDYSICYVEYEHSYPIMGTPIPYFRNTVYTASGNMLNGIYNYAAINDGNPSYNSPEKITANYNFNPVIALNDRGDVATIAWLTGKHGQQNIVPVFTSGSCGISTFLVSAIINADPASLSNIDGYYRDIMACGPPPPASTRIIDMRCGVALSGDNSNGNGGFMVFSGYETPINTYQTYQKTVPWSAYIAGSSFKTNSISAINTMSNARLNIYPNPVNTELHFETERKNVSYSIAISNSLGQQYFVATNKIEIIEKQLNNSISKWPNGLYLVTVNDNNGNNKIIKINKL
jgi:hypothetical protein